MLARSRRRGEHEYAKELGNRLKDRIFKTIVPHLARGFLQYRKQRLGIKRAPGDCTDWALAIDNNLSERMVRPVAIGRKNYLFVGSDNGRQAAAILYSVLANAKSNEAEPFAYVRDLLVQFSGSSPANLSDLLPDHSLQAHLEARRRWSR